MSLDASKAVRAKYNAAQDFNGRKHIVPVWFTVTGLLSTNWAVDSQGQAIPGSSATQDLRYISKGYNVVLPSAPTDEWGVSARMPFSPVKLLNPLPPYENFLFGMMGAGGNVVSGKLVPGLVPKPYITGSLILELDTTGIIEAFTVSTRTGNSTSNRDLTDWHFRLCYKPNTT
jgi:hypothetical protein